MRKLTLKQKQLLNKWMQRFPDIKSVDDLSTEQFAELEKINDTEILYQEVNRYIHDKRWENIVKGGGER